MIHELNRQDSVFSVLNNATVSFDALHGFKSRKSIYILLSQTETNKRHWMFFRAL